MAATRTRVLGTTRIQEALAEGGMGAIYVGEQETLGRQVAVKVILPKVAGQQDDAIERFRREAQVLAGLQHENIVAIHDLVEKNDQLFMVLEYVDGVDLETALEGGQKLPLEVALSVGVGVARALEHAHFRKVIHRDVKPANVLLSRHGVVKLVDFGLAKDLELDGLTKTGMLVGTPMYIAPEQLAGRVADRRTDLYALGVVLFRCLTGQAPYVARDRTELFGKIAQGKRLKVKELAPEIPRGVRRIVDRCLEPNADKRWQYAIQLRTALEVELDRRLQRSPGAELIAYLQARKLVEPDPTMELDLDAMTFAEVLGDADIEPDSDTTGAPLPLAAPPRRRRRWLLVTVLVLATLAAGAGVAWLVAPGEVTALWERIAAWFGG